MQCASSQQTHTADGPKKRNYAPGSARSPIHCAQHSGRERAGTHILEVISGEGTRRCPPCRFTYVIHRHTMKQGHGGGHSSGGVRSHMALTGWSKGLRDDVMNPARETRSGEPLTPLGTPIAHQELSGGPPKGRCAVQVCCHSPDRAQRARAPPPTHYAVGTHTE